MSANHVKNIPVRATLAAIVAALATACTVLTGPALAAAPPVKLVLTGHIGGSFQSPGGVAVDNDPASPEHGDVYVGDVGNHRVQELTAGGAFVAMFGWEVNATKDKEPAATQTERNICTAASKDTCQAGVNGPAAGQFSVPRSIAVDPASGNVYIQEFVDVDGETGERVQELTDEGRFVLELGKEVNRTKKTNLCSEQEVEEAGVECGASLESTAAVGVENGAFSFPDSFGDLMAVGGKEDLLYVGEKHRVQEFKADGTWVGEIPLTSISAAEDAFVSTLAVEQETGDVDLVYGSSVGSDTVREFDSSGKEAMHFAVGSRQLGQQITVFGLAVDSSGNIAVSADEISPGNEFGSLYDAATGRRITEFTVPSGEGEAYMSFGSGDVLYAGAQHSQEVLVYTPELVAELLAKPGACAAGLGSGTSVAFACTLEGEVNPEGVEATEALFEWGSSEALGETTSRQPVATGSAPVPFEAQIDGVLPNETIFYRLAGYDQHVQPPERLSSERVTVRTPSVPPRVVGAPSASFVSSSSAVFSGAVNPENTSTSYEFQYAKECAGGEVCPGIGQAPGLAQTSAQESAAYGEVGVTQSAGGLQPASTYRFRLVAVNQAGEAAVNASSGQPLPEGTFTTAPAPVPQAATGGASGVAATSAVISGSVDPDGLPASYSFEMGVYEGAATQYGVVFSGPAGSGSVPVEESYALIGLQPGVTYAFRIVVHSGYIHDSENALLGSPALFTTAGVSSVLLAPTPIALVAVPGISFPQAAPGVKAKKAKKSKQKAKRKGGSQGGKRMGRAKGHERAAGTDARSDGADGR